MNDVLLFVSTFSVPVVVYAAETHPNADALEMAVVGGWRAACRIGQFEPGQTVAYIPEGSLLPWDLVVELGLDDPPRLAGPDHNRVKAIRLRGVLSQGIVYGGERIAGLSAGDDAAEVLGVVKWVPPVPVHMSGLMVPGPKIGYCCARAAPSTTSGRGCRCGSWRGISYLDAGWVCSICATIVV